MSQMLRVSPASTEVPTTQLNDSDAQLARRWTHLSWRRGILEAVSIISLSVAILHLGELGLRLVPPEMR
jgi:hypothetical protein